MDEPEAPLSFTSTLSLLARLDDLRADGPRSSWRPTRRC